MKEFVTIILVWAIFVIAATFEVGGDGLIRKGLEGKVSYAIPLGLGALCVYGFILNIAIYAKIVSWGFSKQLGVYVAIFAVISTLIGWRYFDEKIPATHLVGLGLIVLGGIVIQFGQK